jgi:phosphoribosylglycinamide formyltransferase-1
MKKLAIFASGSGSNGLKIYEYFKDSDCIKIECIVVNNQNAGIIKKARAWNCDVIHISKENFYSSETISKLLKKRGVNLIVLAGFLWLIPKHLLNYFPEKIINIHPALLPKYGGKGMYGMNVHEAVFEAKEKESGITIHTINEEYDKGKILFQKVICIKSCKSPKEVASKILKIEHENFAPTIEKYLSI